MPLPDFAQIKEGFTLSRVAIGVIVIVVILAIVFYYLKISGDDSLSIESPSLRLSDTFSIPGTVETDRFFESYQKITGDSYTFSTQMIIYNSYSPTGNLFTPLLLCTDTDLPSINADTTPEDRQNIYFSHNQNPGIYLDSIKNNLFLIFTTLVSDSAGAMQTRPESIIIENYPLRKPFTLTITMTTKSVSVYIDSHLVRTGILKGIPISLMPSTLKIYSGQNGGFMGEYINPRFWSGNLDYEKIKELSKERYPFTNSYIADMLPADYIIPETE